MALSHLAAETANRHSNASLKRSAMSITASHTTINPAAKCPANLATKSALVALALAATLPLTATMADAKVCKSFSVAKSGGKKWTNISARVSARTEWRRHVRKTYGWKWSVYAMARSKSYSCRRVGLKWRCTAHGRPCRGGN